MNQPPEVWTAETLLREPPNLIPGASDTDPMAGTEHPAPPGSGWWNPFPEYPEFRIRVVGESRRAIGEEVNPKEVEVPE